MEQRQSTSYGNSTIGFSCCKQYGAEIIEPKRNYSYLWQLCFRERRLQVPSQACPLKIRIKITGFDAGEIFGGEGAALSALYTGREDGRGGLACTGNCAGFRRAGMNLCLCF